MKIITIVGTGYVGLTTASILSNVGYKVHTIDIDKNKIDIIKSGKSYFFEAGLDEFVKKGIETNKLLPTTSYEEAIPDSDIIFICVGTPSNDDGSVNLDYVYEAVKSIMHNATRDLIIVQKSTVPVETGKRVERLIQKHNKNNVKISLISSPEFLRESSAVFDTLFFDRIVVGGKDKAAIEEIVDIYRKVDEFAKAIDYKNLIQYAFLNINSKYIENLPAFENRVVRTDLESAELIKVTANSFLALKISFANTISRICAKTGANSSQVMEGIGLDTRIGRAFLYPGLGYGGGCFPKDVAGMINTANAYDVSFGILDEVVKINDTQVYIAISKIKELLGDDLEGKRVAFLGLSFKPGTSDVRESPSLRLLNKILSEGMLVKAYDPAAISEAKEILTRLNLNYVENLEETFDQAEIIILATEWKEFIDFDYSKIIDKMKALNFFDGRCVVDRGKLEQIGFNVAGF
jgi:UDPglucose 6-dehydrogenase